MAGGGRRWKGVEGGGRGDKGLNGNGKTEARLVVHFGKKWEGLKTPALPSCSTVPVLCPIPGDKMSDYML